MIAVLACVGGHIQVYTGYEPNAQGSPRGGGHTWMQQAVGGTGPVTGMWAVQGVGMAATTAGRVRQATAALQGGTIFLGVWAPNSRCGGSSPAAQQRWRVPRHHLPRQPAAR